MLILPNPGNARDFPSGSLLRFQYCAGAEGVAAVQRQAVIEDMKYARHKPNILP